MPESSAGDQIVTWVGNGASVGAVGASLLGYLPPIAALIAFIWYIIQIYESNTLQKWLKRRRLKRIAKLRETLAALECKTNSGPPSADPAVLPVNDR